MLDLALVNWGEWPTMCKHGAYTLFACRSTRFGLVVDHEGDSLVEFFVVHLPSIGQLGPGCYGYSILYLCFSLVISLCMNVELIFCYN